MPRVRTDAAERTRQNHHLVEQVSAELGRTVTVREAQAYRRTQKDGKPFPGRIVQREVDLSEDKVRYIGQLLAQVEDFKIIRGVQAGLTLTTSPDFRHLLLDASVISRSGMLCAILFEIPRDLGLDDPDDNDEDDEESDWT